MLGLVRFLIASATLSHCCSFKIIVNSEFTIMHWISMRLKHFKIGIHEICAFCLIIFATVLRIILISQGWPETNSDEGTMGLMALHIAYRHEHPIFFYGQGYMGSFEAYCAAVLFHLFGASLITLRLALVIIFALFLASIYLLTSQLYTKNLALVTLSLLSLGSIGVLFTQLRAIGGYAETLLFGSLLLLLATWLALSYGRNLPIKKRLLRYLLYACWGYLVGLAIWTDLLIMPFVLMSGLFLLLLCWPDLDSWTPTCVISSFIIGVLPVFVYNIRALPERSSLFYFLLVYRGDTTGQFLQHVPLIQRMVGALLIGLPNATGANPICFTQNLPLFGLFSPTSFQCTLREGSWTLGCIALWLIAVFLAIKALWQQRRQVRTGWVNFEDRQTAIRYAARLMLLGSTGLTFLLFAFSPVAALDPWTNSRYLICLLIATPAVIAPLWKNESPIGPLSSTWLSRLNWLLTGLKGAILLYVGSMLLLGAIGTFNNIPTVQSIDQRQQGLISDLLHIGSRDIISEYWTCNRIIFQSNERIICSVVDERLRPGYNRYEPYYYIVQKDAHASFVFPLGSPEAAYFARRVAHSSKRYHRFVFDGYVVYQPT